eukprot:86463-Chlamydomonas_euryale.AAC.1
MTRTATSLSSGSAVRPARTCGRSACTSACCWAWAATCRWVWGVAWEFKVWGGRHVRADALRAPPPAAGRGRPHAGGVGGCAGVQGVGRPARTCARSAGVGGRREGTDSKGMNEPVAHTSPHSPLVPTFLPSHTPHTPHPSLMPARTHCRHIPAPRALTFLQSVPPQSYTHTHTRTHTLCPHFPRAPAGAAPRALGHPRRARQHGDDA